MSHKNTRRSSSSYSHQTSHRAERTPTLLQLPSSSTHKIHFNHDQHKNTQQEGSRQTNLDGTDVPPRTAALENVEERTDKDSQNNHVDTRSDDTGQQQLLLTSVCSSGNRANRQTSQKLKLRENDHPWRIFGQLNFPTSARNCPSQQEVQRTHAQRWGTTLLWTTAKCS